MSQNWGIPLFEQALNRRLLLMKLYVHYEDARVSWTQRLNVDPAAATLERVLAQFREYFVAKFTREFDLSQIVVFTERHQNDSTRQQIADAKFTQTLQQLGICLSPDRYPSSDVKNAPCDVEVVVTTKSPASSIDAHCDTLQATHSDDVDVDLRAILDIALRHLKARRHRVARETYEKLVLSVDPTHPEALLGLGEVYFSIGKYGEAADRYFKVCWRTHRKQPRGKVYALMAFTGGLKLVECQLKTHSFHDALSTLDDLQKFLRRHSKCKSFFCDSVDRERMEAQMDFLRACALYKLETPADQETAISLLLHLLPDLQGPRVNLDALQLYARVAQDRGCNNEALSMLLRVLVGRSNGHSVRKQLVELLRGKNGLEMLLQVVPTTTPSAAAAYAFAATILKDFGALDTSVQCFEHALTLKPSSAAYALNLAHVLEVCNRYQDAHDSLIHFLRSNASLHVLECLQVSDVLEVVGPDSWGYKCSHSQALFDRWSFEWKEEDGEGFATVYQDGKLFTVRSKPETRQMSEEDLDLLACFFTLAKILFINGRLHPLPGLVALLEPLRIGHLLHKTTIRNEQAYYMCIAQLLCVNPPLIVPDIRANQTLLNDPVDAPTDSTTYVCGDSHTLATAWRVIRVHNSPIQLRPALVTGLKHWHLRRESEFYPKTNFWNVLDSLPRRSRVIFLLGEIDCREGILQAVELCKYETVQEGMEHTIGIFMSALTEIFERYNFEIFIHPVVPVLNETRHLVILYNHIFKSKVAASKLCKWLDFFDDLIEGSPPRLRSCYKLDGTHLHPSYLGLLERELGNY